MRLPGEGEKGDGGEGKKGRSDEENLKLWFGELNVDNRRLLCFDLDGTLVSTLWSEQALHEPPAELKASLRYLAWDPYNVVIVCSGSSKEQMEEWFTDVENLYLM